MGVENPGFDLPNQFSCPTKFPFFLEVELVEWLLTLVLMAGGIYDSQNFEQKQLKMA
jgi:hypothetical protein